METERGCEEYGDRHHLSVVAPGVAYVPEAIVNCYFVRERGAGDRG